MLGFEELTYQYLHNEGEQKRFVTCVISEHSELWRMTSAMFIHQLHETNRKIITNVYDDRLFMLEQQEMLIETVKQPISNTSQKPNLP